MKGELAVPQKKPVAFVRLFWPLAKIVWIVSIIAIAAAVGAHSGWEIHGLAGALAPGFAGLVAGGFLSSSPLIAFTGVAVNPDGAPSRILMAAAEAGRARHGRVGPKEPFWARFTTQSVASLQ